jgi:hypothetical protein
MRVGAVGPERKQSKAIHDDLRSRRTLCPQDWWPQERQSDASSVGEKKRPSCGLFIIQGDMYLIYHGTIYCTLKLGRVTRHAAFVVQHHSASMLFRSTLLASLAVAANATTGITVKYFKTTDCSGSPSHQGYGESPGGNAPYSSGCISPSGRDVGWIGSCPSNASTGVHWL